MCRRGWRHHSRRPPHRIHGGRRGQQPVDGDRCRSGCGIDRLGNWPGGVNTRYFNYELLKYVLENMALEGRGSVQYIRPDEDARPYVEKFYDQIRSHPEKDWVPRVKIFGVEPDVTP